MAKILLSTVANSGNKKFKIPKVKGTERDADIEILGDDADSDFVVQKLSVDGIGLPTKYGDDDIVWLNNFAIKKKIPNENNIDKYPFINQRYKIKIAGLSAMRAAGKKILIVDGNSEDNVPSVFNGAVDNDTIELTDGDPAIGGSPP